MPASCALRSTIAYLASFERSDNQTPVACVVSCLRCADQAARLLGHDLTINWAMHWNTRQMNLHLIELAHHQ